MIRTNNFVKALSDKGFVDDAMILENGYDIQYKGNIVSVRLNDKGSAFIYNQKKNTAFEVSSGRLDTILHKYIIQSLFGVQNKVGVKDMSCKNVFLVPTKVIQNSVIFEDSVGRKWTMKGNSPKAVLSYYNEACNVNADDCMILLNNFVAYNRAENQISSSVETPDVEVQILKCSVNMDDYAVSPKAELINNVGQTIVGNFLCSAADKWNLMSFNDYESKVFAYNSANRKGITSSTIRSKNPLVTVTQNALKNSAQVVSNYIDRKYPEGLCCSALEHVIAYEAPAICNEAKINVPQDYKFLFNNMLKNADKVQFRLDSNKSILCAIEKECEWVAKFRAVPVLSEMKQPLFDNGYMLSELESGIEFNLGDTAITAIVSACKEFVPVVENTVNKPNRVTKMVGSACKEELRTFGVDDRNGVFSSFYQIVVN